MLRDPYIARRSPGSPVAQSQLSFLNSLVCFLCSAPGSSQVPLFRFLLSHEIPCSVARPQPPKRLLCFAVILLAHYIPGSVSSTLHVSLPVFPFSQTHLCSISIIAICFDSFPHSAPLPTRISITYNCSCRNCIPWDCLSPRFLSNIQTYHRCR